ncbi:hypothetical protein KY348_04300 [Candidatus Woesearchaeota archaeon]|nr:hypothetical protein [Candidatus Woesearchaeota archaeon]
MKKILTVLILIGILLIGVKIVLAEFEGIRFGANVWCCFNTDSVEADMKKIAEFYDMLVFNENKYNWVLKSREWNPDAIILNYKVIMCNELDYTYGSCRDYSKLKEDWFVHRNGEKICAAGWEPGDIFYEKECYMDISNPEVRQYMIDGYLDLFENYPEFDGLWIDLAPSSLYYYRGATDKIRTDQEAFDSYQLYIREVDDALDDIGKIFIPEWSVMSREGNWDDLILNVDGAWDEAFYWGWRGSRKPDSEIKQQINDCRFTIQNNRIYGAGIWTWENPVSDFQDMVQEAYDKLKECGNHHIFLFHPSGYGMPSALRGVDILSDLDTGGCNNNDECGPDEECINHVCVPKDIPPECASGDVNCNGIIDIYDLNFVTSRFGITPSHANWNISADLTEPEGIIDIFDVVFVAARIP